MKSYEIGEEVFAVAFKTVDEKETGIGKPLSGNMVIKAAIKNRVEPDENPANFLYEVEGHEGTIKANRIFSNGDQAKQCALDNTKEGPMKEYLKKTLK
jgi:hypothetical protein